MSLSIAALEQLLTQAHNRVEQGENIAVLHTEFLGRKGALNELLRQLPSLAPAERKDIGATANHIKHELEAILSKRAGDKPSENIDLSLPIQVQKHGHEHPVQKTIGSLYQIFGSLGFTYFSSPEIETESANFDALRVAKDHPARDMQDTFWTTTNTVLRTHTTAFQREALQTQKPPFAVMQAGKIYRAEAEDATHLSEFHQFDCFAVGENLSFSHVKGMLTHAMRQLFGENAQIRFRPSFFPFVEPGAEIDLRCPHCYGNGCKSCGKKGWLEMLGCGVTHPEILEKAGLDPQKYHGIAWGIGIERLAMVKYQIDDIREFTKNNPRFLEQIT